MNRVLVGLTGLFLIAAMIAAGCRQNSTGPSTDSTKHPADSSVFRSLVSMTHVRIDFGGDHVFTTTYPWDPADTARIHNDTLALWSASNVAALVWSGTELSKSVSLAYDSNYFSYTIGDTTSLAFSPDGRTLLNVGAIHDESWSDGRQPNQFDYVLNASAIPLVSSSADSAVFQLSGYALQLSIARFYQHNYNTLSCSIDGHATDYDSTAWSSRTNVPTLRVTLTR